MKNTVTQAWIDDIISATKFEATTVFDKCTILVAELPNGFIIVESSACVDVANYDVEMGISICKERIKNKVWELEGYVLQSTQ